MNAADKNSAPLFVLQGNGSMLNLGCEAILRSTADLLRAEFGACRIVHAPASVLHDRTEPEHDPDIVHDIPPTIPRISVARFIHLFRRFVLRQSCFHFERHLKEARATLAVGGDNYSLYYGLPYGFFRANDTTLRRGKPLFLWGASVGPFTKNPEFERFAMKELRRITIICARETETVAYLASIGIRDNVRLVADPAFTLRKTAPAQCDIPDAALQGDAIGLNFSPLIGKYRNTGRSWEEEAAACVNALARGTNRPLVFIPHVLAPWTNDRAFMEGVIRRLPHHRDRLHLAARDYNCCEIKWIIARMGVFIGARTHATIAAMSSEVPTLSIGYSIKAKGINRDLFGTEDWLVPAEELAPEPFVERVNALLGAAATVRSNLKAALPAYQERARLGARLVREYS
jgi:polysaccharide pyruvyl transferase WcaK-like protein